MRVFMIDGEKYTTFEYGMYMLDKTFSEGNGILDPKVMTHDEISAWGLGFILVQLSERDDIEEIVS
ncbi:hypothetical protein [Paenibacillus sp. NAIST15-1]|uniref:hypothetical protein n=1 Tax=Paenibacillus sp. NAIST15-1 TaxID=1605994 RepID=UPI0008693B04|nr:hypothetical protein [Paenibacillus sp. NAIST15-1]GAV11330.1 argininosuccinate lyase [Paenibacillus sp. NAIST15-1]